jgi:hypothetical protein
MHNYPRSSAPHPCTAHSKNVTSNTPNCIALTSRRSSNFRSADDVCGRRYAELMSPEAGHSDFKYRFYIRDIRSTFRHV